MADDLAPRRLFHVVNIALNVVSTKRLAWQERKAELFTVSPLHCGSAYLGFRSSATYGDGPDKDATPKQSAPEKEAVERSQAADSEPHVYGIALGTAMAISGAAVSPNMGYHSSPSITLLLTLFNVRLGWWLGNPGQAGNQDKAYQHEGPKMASRPLFYEAVGETTDTGHTSICRTAGISRTRPVRDGAAALPIHHCHRRRLRSQICIRGSRQCGAKNLHRSWYADQFEGLDKLRNRPSDEEIDPRANRNDPLPCHRHYPVLDADGKVGKDAGCENGTVLYIKPAYHGTEGAGSELCDSEQDLPHETTTDQWFTESQFESYRSLGMDITNKRFGR